MNSIFLAISAATQMISGALINSRDMTIVSRIEPETSYTKNIIDALEDYTDKALSISDSKGIKPVSICISAKGNPKESLRDIDRILPPTKRKPKVDGSFLCSDKNTICEILKNRLSIYRKDLPLLFVINRFQSFAYGAFLLRGSYLSDSYSCINMSNGVGCGNIIRGDLLQSYTSSGVGGLRKMICSSNKREMKIASIAGINAIMNKMKSCHYDSIESCISKELTLKSPFMKDIIDAIAELIIKEIPNDIMHIGINVYNNKIPLAIREVFVNNVFEHVKSRMEQFKYITVFDTSYDEDTVKMFGAVNFALSELRKTKVMSTPIFTHNNIFVIEGLPGTGKSTLARKLYEELITQSGKIACIISNEIRLKRKRAGFEVMISGNDKPLELAIIADRDVREIYDRSIYRQFGRYWVNYYNIHEYIVPSIWRLLNDNDILIIDEVAGMQLFCQDFLNTISTISHGRKNIIFTVPKISGKYPLIQNLKMLANSRNNLYTLSVTDRDESQKEILKNLIESLTKKY